MKTRQTVEKLLLAVLALLLVYFGYGWYSRNHVSGDEGFTATKTINFSPIAVENPALRLDLLERLKKMEYEGTHRNIFSASAPPPPPAAPVQPVAAQPAVPSTPPPPPALTIPATFFGYVTDARSGSRRAFFNEGDNVYVVGIGDTLLGRFRLLQIGNNSAELEETASGRRATVTMEEPGPAS